MHCSSGRAVTLFFAALLFAWGSVGLADEPEEIARKLVLQYNNGDGDKSLLEARILETGIAYPTEPVLLEMLNFPLTESGPIYRYLAARIHRSELLLEKAMLLASSEGATSRQMGLLPSSMGNPRVANQVMDWVRQNKKYADSLIPFLPASDELKKLLIERKDIVNLGLLFPKDPQTIWLIQENMGKSENVFFFSDSTQFILLHKSIEVETRKILLDSSQDVSIRASAACSLAALDPGDKAVHRVLLELLDKTLIRSSQDKFDYDLFQLAFALSSRVPELPSTVAQGVEISTKALEAGEEFDDLELTFLANLYAQVLSRQSNPDLSNLRAFLGAMNKERRTAALGKLLLAGHSPVIEKLVGEFAQDLTARSLLGQMHFTGQLFPSFAIDVAKRSLTSGDPSELRHAATILKQAVDQDESILPFLNGLLGSGDVKVAAITQETLRLVDPSSDAASAPSKNALFRRRILHEQHPPRGWPNLVQRIALNYNDDPLKIGSEALSETEKKMYREGDKLRSESLRSAEEELRHAGYLARPTSWLLEQYRQRKRVINAEAESTPLTLGEKIKLEVLAKQNIAALNPSSQVDFDEEPFRTFFNRELTRLEINFRKQIRMQVRDPNNVASETWRHETELALQNHFRKSLLIALEHGRLVAHDTDFDLNAQDGSVIDVTAADIPHISILPKRKTPPYRRTIHWNGRDYKLDIITHSMDGISPLNELAAGSAQEMGILTLGSHRGTVRQMAQETYLALTFARWMEELSVSLDHLRDASGNTIGEKLEHQGVIEAIGLQQSLQQKTQGKVLNTLLWAPLSRNPNHWRDREAAAVSEGRPVWNLLAEDPRAADGALFDGVPLQHPGSYRPSSGMSEISDRLTTHDLNDLENALLDSSLRGVRIFFIESEEPPAEFLHFPSDQPERLQILRNPLYRYHDRADVKIFTEFYIYADNQGYAVIPRPVGNDIHTLDSLEVFTVSGRPLYQGKDYEVVEDSFTTGVAPGSRIEPSADPNRSTEAQGCWVYGALVGHCPIHK